MTQPTNRQTWTSIDSRATIAQAAGEGRVERGEAPDWRANALHMSGEYATVVGGQAKSREYAKQFEEGGE